MFRSEGKKESEKEPNDIVSHIVWVLDKIVEKKVNDDLPFWNLLL